jgi:hypothetical protein
MQIRDTPAEIQDYFTFFTSEPNLRVSGYQPFVRTFGDFAINSGKTHCELRISTTVTHSHAARCCLWLPLPLTLFVHTQCYRSVDMIYAIMCILADTTVFYFVAYQCALTGYYTFTWSGESGQPDVQKRARYSFAYRRDASKPCGWAIIDHHSSALPTAPSQLRHASL